MRDQEVTIPPEHLNRWVVVAREDRKVVSKGVANKTLRRRGDRTAGWQRKCNLP